MVNERDIVLSNEEEKLERLFGPNLSDEEYLKEANKIVNDEKPEYMMVAFDIGKTFRHEKYERYKKNLKEIEGLSTRLADSMDETTVASFKALASAMEDSLIGAFEKFKPALLDASDALTTFFSEWRNGDKNTYNFEGLETGLENLKAKVENAAKQIPTIITNAISGANRLISGGALDSLLSMGSSIVQI